MQNYNDLVVNTLIETSTSNVLKVVNYEKTSENNKAKTNAKGSEEAKKKPKTKSTKKTIW